MEIIKPLVVPDKLKLMRSLNARMELSAKDKKCYSDLEKGYQGEVIFCDWLGRLTNDLLLLNDVTLECNSTLFQTDKFLLSQHTLYQFEVKNFEGDYYIENKNWYAYPKIDVNNPVHQLDREETLFRQIIQRLGYNFSITPFVVFVNPNFHLYNAPMNQPIIYPTQINRFIQKLSSTPSKLTQQHYSLANQLTSLHINQSPYKFLPPYNYNSLEKGTCCGVCYSLDTEMTPVNMIVCRNCGASESVETAVLRSVEELSLLFPGIKITTSLVLDWCKIIGSRKTLRRILLMKYSLIKLGQSSYFLE